MLVPLNPSPEVRLKQHVEVRGADSCSVELNGALSALWRAMAYDETARTAGASLAEGWSSSDHEAAHRDAARLGLHASLRGVPLGELAEDLLDIAHAGLLRLDPADAPLLQPLRACLEAGPPAIALLADWKAEGPAAFLKRL